MMFIKIWKPNKLIFISLLAIWFLSTSTTAIKIEPLINTTTFKPYTDATIFPHLSFDTPLQEGGKLVDSDDTSVYLLARESWISEDTYRFMTVKHSDLSSTSKVVTILGYQLNGMCQYNGNLEFFIGVHVETKEIRVCNLRYDSVNGSYSTLYWKNIPYNLDIDTQHIYAECKYTGKPNSYIIAIGASAFDSSNPGQYNYF